jgi:hypothetical protein
MNTTIILLALAGFVWGAQLSIDAGKILPTRMRGGQCSDVCSCNYGECEPSQEGSNGICRVGTTTTDCCSYCQG